MTGDTVELPNPIQRNRRALLRMSVLVEGGMLVVALLLGLLMGVHFWEAVRLDLKSAAMGAVAGLLLLAAAAAVTESSLPFAVQMRRDIDRLLHLFRGATLADFLLISMLAGLGEEALFRGLLQTWLTEHLGFPLAVLLSAVAFGTAHYISRAYVVFTAVLGLLFGALYFWSGNLAIPMIAHAVYDFAALCFVYRDTRRRHGT